jgi:hypothetical protein
MEKALPFLHFIASLVIIAKTVIISRAKGFDVPEITFSFFRLYNGDQLDLTSSRKKRNHMLVNNYLNFYLYGWMLLTGIFFFITQRFY